ncbi:hypothetical protein OG196_00515 [Kitasatospora purpeofusca]|uniref:hypothetical protein n=1 Tax=Kitasatospora purpeofusca TaxID=67352 RepID=UPI002E1479B6|nr:hypothetical protein OG196_00515 [Kitasatospora purpeofusca]
MSRVCWTCPVQGRTVHPSVRRGRPARDAARHARPPPQERLALAQIALRPLSEEERPARIDTTVPTVPPFEGPDPGRRRPARPDGCTDPTAVIRRSGPGTDAPGRGRAGS